MSLPFGTQQAFFSRVELVAPVDDWRASRCVARCPAWFCFFSWTLVACGEQGFGAVVPPHGLARGCTAALAQGCTVLLSLRTLELVGARVAVVKGAPKFPNNPARKLLRVLAQRALAPRPPGKVSYVLLTRYLIPR